MFQSNATISSLRSGSSTKSVAAATTNSCSRNSSSMPSSSLLQMHSTTSNPLSPKTSFNPIFRQSNTPQHHELTSFDASHFIFQEQCDKKQRLIRRYNSHDSNFSASGNSDDNMVDASSRSRRLWRTSTAATTNSSTGSSDRSTDERINKNKKLHQYGARDFLERYSLPRVVSVAGGDDGGGGGEPMLLYRCFDSFTKIEAKGVQFGRKGKERTVDNEVLHFPEGYSGWFSLINEKGEKNAVIHTTILQLVREQVCSFISMQPFTAYATSSSSSQNSTEHTPSDGSGKVQYIKTQVRTGQLFQLRAVFQHKDPLDGGGGIGGGKHASTRSSSRVPRSLRDKDLANRYAQLVSQNNQELYVSLTTKGEFYEIHSSMKARLCFPGLLDKTGPLAIDKDCLYRITHLLRRISLPVKVKLIAGPLPPSLPKDFTDTFILERKFQKPLMVVCTLPAPSSNIPHKIGCINLNSNLKLSKSTLGFDSENRLFKSQRLQAALAFCHKNVEVWYREVRLVPNLMQQQGDDDDVGAKSLLLDLNSKVDDCNTEITVDDNTKQQIITQEVLEKFPKAKKWYKHYFKIYHSNNHNGKVVTGDGTEKCKSIERYKDMSKLIEEKFGGSKSSNPVKKSASFMFSAKSIDFEAMPTTSSKTALLKCQSLDTQLHHHAVSSSSSSSINNNNNKYHQRRSSKSTITGSCFSEDFQMCILDDDNNILINNTEDHHHQSLSDIRRSQSNHFYTTEIDFDDEIMIKSAANNNKLNKNKPDLIPTLPKQTDNTNYSNGNKDNSYITDRLRSEFHVKTKIQKTKLFNKPDEMVIRSSGGPKGGSRLTIFEQPRTIDNTTNNITLVNVQEAKLSTKCANSNNVEDVPYGHVADAISAAQSSSLVDDDCRKISVDDEENIYAEICELNPSTCNNNCCDNNRQLCECIRTNHNNKITTTTTTDKSSEYCYVKLGSNGESVQSDSDEAVYNTLR